MMKHNDCGCKMANENVMPMSDNMAAYSNMSCNVAVKRYLEPVLVAKIYNQPIVEEVPYSAMSLTLDNTSTITSACSEMKPMCDNCGCDDGYNYTL